MDWGGVIAGAMGGGAQAIGQIADNNLRVREQEASEQRRAVLDEERANRAMDRKLQLEEQQRDLRGKRLMDQQDQIGDKAVELREGKNLGALTDTQSRISGDAPSASKEELAAMMADPKNRQIYEDAGYIPKVTQSGLVRDRMDAARAIGADPELRKELGQEYQQTTQAEAAAIKNERELKEIARKEARDEDRHKEAMGMVGAANARASRDRDGNGKDDLTIAEQRRAADSLSNAEKRASSRFRKPTIQETMDPKAAQEYQDALSAFVANDKSVLAAESHLTRVQEEVNKRLSPSSGKTDKPSAPINKLPSGAKQIGTSGGKPVYETPDGKRFIGK